MSSVGLRRRGWGEKLRRALSAAVVVLLGTGAFALGATPAVAGPNPSIDSSPVAATTATPLEWTFSNASPASCQLTDGATMISALADCTSPADFDVSADAGGSYTFTVYAAAASDVVVGTTPSATSSVDVAPVAPTITAEPTSPDNDATPSWSFTLPTAATATCEVDDPSGDAVDTLTDCTSPYTSPDLNHAPANGANGTYSLSVTPTAGGVAGAAATSSYIFDTVTPAAPVVSADAVTGFSRHPTFTVSGLVAGGSLTCSVTPPAGGPAVTVQTCGATSALGLAGGIDGSYTLNVTQTEAGNVSAVGSATYLLDTHTPATPTVIGPSTPGADSSPTFAVSGIESGAQLLCSVTGPSTVPVTTCGSSTVLDMSSAANGTYQLSVVAQDAAGKDSAHASASYEFEGAPPSAPVVTAPSSPGRNRTPSFTVTDSDPVALTYSCSVAGPSSVTTAQCGPDTQLALSGAADGTYVLSVTAIDGLGQTSPAGQASYTLDTVAPPAPTVTAPSSPSSDASPAFSINESEAGTTLTCTVSGPSSFPVPPADCASGLVVDLSGPGRDGVYTLSVTATDAAGNVSVNGTATYTLDTTPPPAPTIVAPTSPSKSLMPTFVITDAESGVTLNCMFVDPNATVVFSGTCPANGSFDTSGDARDGTYHLLVTASDAAGNESSTLSSWTRDTTAPPVPIVTAPTSPSKDITPSFTVTESEADATLNCVLTGPGGVAVSSGVCPGDGLFDLTGFGDGSYLLSVTATDPAGNVSAAGIASYTLDTTPPPAPTVALSAPLLSLSNVTMPQFSVSDSEAGVTYTCSVAGITPVPASAVTCGSTTTVDLSGLGRDGSYTLSVWATDAAGNVSSAGTATYSLDTTPPPSPAVTAPPSPSNDLTPTFTISDGDPTVVLTCALSGPGGTIVFSNLCPANGTFDLAGFGDGTYALTVTATDPAGNLAPATGTATYLLDTTPPPIPAVTLSVPTTSPGRIASPAFTVSDSEPGVSYSCTVTGPTAVPASAITCGTTTTLNLSGAGRDGRYRLSVTATDAAGNTSAARSAAYTLDTTPPPTPVVTLSVPAASPGDVSSPQFAVSDTEAGVTFSCSVVGVTPVPPSAVTCGATTTVNLSGAGRDGAYTLSVTATDAAGNASSVAAAPYTLDTTPPPTPVVTLSVPATSPGNVTSPRFAVSDTEAGVSYSCAVTGTTPVPPSAVMCGATTTVTLSGAGRDGSYSLSVTATDAAGNTSGSASATYTLDTTPPPPPTVTLSSPSSSPSNDVEPVFAVTDTEAGVVFSCVVSGPTPVPSSAVGCGSTTAVDLSGVGRDGTYQLMVTATDAAGNTSTAGMARYVVDTTPPPAPGVALSVPSSSPGNVTSPQFAVTDTEAGVSFSCSVTGATAVSSTAITCGSTTIVNLSGAGRDGSYTLSVTATDVAGNVSATSTTTYVLDTTPPPAPVVTEPGASTKQPTFGISDGDPTAVLTCALTSPKGRTVFPISPPATCPGTGTFDTTAFADGTYTLIVTATDPAGNATSTTVTWVRDTIPPPVPTVALSDPSSSPGNVTAPQFAVTDSESDASFTCSVTGVTPVPSSAINCGATTTLDLSGTGRDGLYTLSVTATDPSGNVSVAGTATYTLDTTAPPSPSVALSTPAASPSNATAPQFAVSDTEPGVLYTCTVSGATTVPASAITCGETTTVSLAGTGRDGVYTLSVTATDAAGNTSGSASATYTLDTTPPPAPTVALAVPASSPSNDTSPSFSVSDSEPGVTFACSVSGTPQVPSSAISCGSTTTVNLSGASRDGTYVLSVTATDAANNTSPTAGTITYTLDTTAPYPPNISLANASTSSIKTPLWIWQFGFGDPGLTTLDTATCTVDGPNGWSSTTPNCHHHFQPTLLGGDGNYTLTVTLTDEAGNSASSEPSVYTLDSSAPAGPTILLVRPSSGAGLDRHPIWFIGRPAGTTLMCTLRRGGKNGVVISPQASCPPGQTTYSLVGSEDGVYTLVVVTVDAAQNVSKPAASSYVLEPSAPRVQAPQSQSPTAVWTIVGNPADPTVCTLTDNGVVFDTHNCGMHPTYDMSRMPPGKYVLSVVQIGAEGVRSAPGSASWTWDGVKVINPAGGGPGPGHHHHHQPGAGPTPPHNTGPLSSLPAVVRKQLQKLRHVVSSVVPFVHPIVHLNRITKDVSKAVQNVFHEVGAAGGGTGFPLLLVGLVLIFLIVQNRIDRRDPKLALASIAADDTVEFHPPPSRRDRP